MIAHQFDTGTIFDDDPWSDDAPGQTIRRIEGGR